MSGMDWLAVGIMAVALIVVFVWDQAEKSARWRRDTERPISRKTLARYRDQDQS